MSFMANATGYKYGRRLFIYFKALGNPIRFLIIHRMMDGRPYTKNEILSYVGALSDVPKTTIDRHFRTLLKYGVVRVMGKSIKHGEKGRKPLLYVLAVDSLTFYINLFTCLFKGASDIHLRLLEKGLSDVESLLYMIDDVKLKLYLISDKIDNEVSTSLIKTLDRSNTLFSLIREMIRPRISVAGCENALEFLKNLSSSQTLIGKVPIEKVKRLLYTTYMESNMPIKKLGSLLGIRDLTKIETYDDVWREIEIIYSNDLAALLATLTNNIKCPEEGEFIVSLANNLIKHISNEVRHYDLIQLILTL